jgi:hypothetical protein
MPVKFDHTAPLVTSLSVLSTSYTANDMRLESLLYYGGYFSIRDYNPSSNKVTLMVANTSIRSDLSRERGLLPFSLVPKLGS